jgi:dihydroxyacetone kinase-like protein
MIKKLVNKPGDEVLEMLDGLILAFPNIVRLDSKWNNIYRISKKKDNKVALLSGGGSGHEPAHAGYVGFGMLDCACAGATFTSPSIPQILAGIKEVATETGVLVIIKNYSGDVMNFQSAAKIAKVQGVKVDWVIVNDDVAIRDKSNRRGTGITVFVHKISGALAEQGGSMEDVKRVAQKVIDNGREFGVALTPCSVPAAGKYTFELGEDEIEIGIGIHGEKGVEKAKWLPSSELAKLMVNRVVEDLGVGKGDEITLMVQGTGGTPYMEKLLFYRDVRRYIDSLGVIVYDSWIGEFMSSLEMQGARVGILKLDKELKELLKAPANTVTIHIPGPVIS